MTNVNWDNVTSPSDTIPYTEWINMVGYIKSVIVTDGNVDAGVITSGVLDISTIPALDASNIVTGTFDVARIPDLSANKITSDTFNTSRIPSLDASKITTGYLSTARLGSGTADNTKFLRGDQTWQVVSGGGGGEPLYNAWIAASNAVAGSATGSYAIAIGQSSVANQVNAIAIGGGSAATGVNSFAVLGGATGSNSVSIGIASAALGDESNAIGHSASSSIYGANAFGYGTIASGLYSLALGNTANATMQSSVAVGAGSVSTGDQSVAIGENTQALLNHTTALGAHSYASVENATAIGFDAQATANQAIAIGASSRGTGTNSTALGFGANASAAYGMAIGQGAIASGPGNAQAWGYLANASMNSSIAQGDASVSSGIHSQAQGVLSQATANYAIALGSGSNASVQNSLAIGRSASANGDSSISIGNNAVASGSENYSIVMGINSSVTGSEAVAIGSSSQALSDKSIALGGSTIANSLQSIAIGHGAQANAVEAISIGHGIINAVANTVNIGTNSEVGLTIDTDLNMTTIYDELRLNPLAAAPHSGTEITGEMYYNSGDNKYYYWNGTAWTAMSGGGGGGGSVFNTITLTPQGAPLAPTIGEHYFNSNTEKLYYWDGNYWEEIVGSHHLYCDPKVDTMNFAYGGYYSATQWRGIQIQPLYHLTINRVYLFAQGATRLRCVDSTRTKVFWEILNPIEGYNDIPGNIMLDQGANYFIECYADGATYNAGRSGNNQLFPQTYQRFSEIGGAIDGVHQIYQWTIYDIRTERTGTSEEDPVFTSWKNGSSITAGYNATGYTRAVIIGESAGGATPGYSVLIGYGASSFNGMSVMVGASATGGAECCIVGYNAHATSGYSYFSSAFGSHAVADSYSISLGYRADSQGGNAVAIGRLASTSAPDAVAIGHGVINAVTNTVNIGTNSKIGLIINTDTDTTTINNSLALTPQAQPTGVAGKQYYDSGTHKMYYHNDTTWVEMAAGGGGGGAPYTYLSSVEGAIYTTTLLYHIVNTAGTISEARATLGSLPTGQNVLIDVRKNGNLSTDSIFTSDLPVEITTTQSPVNGVYSSTGTLDAGRTTVAVGDVLFVTITQIGSGLAGADLRVQIKVA